MLNANRHAEIYKQLVLEHNRKPRNFEALEAPSHSACGHNPLCGDRYEVFLEVDADNLVKKATFQGNGCAISRASASMMTEAVTGKPVATVKDLIGEFTSLIRGLGTEREKEGASKLGKLSIFSGLGRYPARVKCAALAWRTLEAALQQPTTNVQHASPQPIVKTE